MTLKVGLRQLDMSLLCQLWSLNEAIQALKDQQQLINKSNQLIRQNNSVSPVMEDTEDIMNDSPENSQDWDIEIEDSEMNGKKKYSKFNIRLEIRINEYSFHRIS